MMRQEEQLLEAFWSNEEQERKLLPRRDVSTSRRHQVTTWRSTITEVNHSPRRRDVITSRRQLKILDLIIKCEGARESRALKNVRPETRIGRPAALTGRFFLDFCIGFSLFAWLFLDYRMVFFILYILFLSLMMF